MRWWHPPQSAYVHRHGSFPSSDRLDYAGVELVVNRKKLTPFVLSESQRGSPPQDLLRPGFAGSTPGQSETRDAAISRIMFSVHVIRTETTHDNGQAGSLGRAGAFVARGNSH